MKKYFESDTTSTVIKKPTRKQLDEKDLDSDLKNIIGGEKNIKSMIFTLLKNEKS